MSARLALEQAANEGRNVLPDATDDQAAVIEAWALRALGATGPVQQIGWLNRREQDALNFIRRHIDEVGFAPTVREVGDEIGLASSASVCYVLDCLVKKGAIRRVHGSPRALSIVETTRP